MPREKTMCLLWLWLMGTKIPKDSEMRFNENPPLEQSIKWWLKQFPESGHVLSETSTGTWCACEDTIAAIGEKTNCSHRKFIHHVSLHLRIP